MDDYKPHNDKGINLSKTRAQQDSSGTEVLTSKPDDLNSTSGTHMVERT